MNGLTETATCSLCNQAIAETEILQYNDNGLCYCPDCYAEPAQHTPGPWQSNEMINGFAIDHAAGFPIVFVSGHNEYEGDPCGSITGQDKTQKEIEANARLIAAAPELLNACQNALAALLDDSDTLHDEEGFATEELKQLIGGLISTINKAKGV